MPISNVLTVGLLQSAALQDTIVMVPHRDLFDWASGIVQVIALLLGLAMLWRMVVVLQSLRAQVHKTATAVERLVAEAHPLLKTATGVLATATGTVADAREVVAMVRTDVERFSELTHVIRERVADAVDVTTQRIDEVNAVLDVLQTQLESTAIGTVSAMHGVRVGARALTKGLTHRDVVDVDDVDEMGDVDGLDDMDDMDDIELDDEATPA
jgi:hypothetical protein